MLPTYVFPFPGCFAMTELKHGSNVAGLQTEAILDVRTDEWVVNVSTGAALAFRVQLEQHAYWAGLDQHGAHSSLLLCQELQSLHASLLNVGQSGLLLFSIAHWRQASQHSRSSASACADA